MLRIELKNGNVFDFSNDYITSVRLEDMVTNSDEIRVGVAPSATLDFTLINKDNILSGKKFEGCKITYFDDLGVKRGIFNESSIDKQRKKISIKSEDNMLKLEAAWLGCAFPITTYNLLLNLCSQCGLTLYTMSEKIPNNEVTIQDGEMFAGCSCREILIYLCEVFGSYANINAEGMLCIDYYDFDDVKDIIDYNDCFTFKINEKESRRAGVMFINGERVLYYGDVNNAYIIEDNPIIEQLSESEVAIVGEAIVERIKKTLLKGGEFSLRTRELREGDVIKVIEENGDECLGVVSNVVIENNTRMTIASYGDVYNSGKSTSTSTSTKTTAGETSASDIYLGRCQNHQKIVIKGGTYTICEKVVNNVTAFTKVNLNYIVNFNYNLNKVIYFDIYANDKIVKSLKVNAVEGFNQYNAGFLADIDLEKSNNVFSCRVTLDDSDLIEIEPFECQMSFIVKAANISDAVATNQYFVEKYKKIDCQTFNPKRFKIKNMKERASTAILLYRVDLSETDGAGVVFGDLYDNGDFDIWGNGRTGDFDNNWNSSIYRFPGTSAAERIKITKLVKRVTIKEGVEYLGAYLFGSVLQSSNYYGNIESISIPNSVTEIGGHFAAHCTNLKEVEFLGTNPIEFKEISGFYGCIKLTNVKGTNRITILKGSDFANCDLTGYVDIKNATFNGGEHFMNNTNITYMDFPCPLEFYNDYNNYDDSFSNCSNLDGCIVFGNVPYYTGSEIIFNKNSFTNAKIRNIIFRPGFKLNDWSSDCSFIKNMAIITNRNIWVCCGDYYIETAQDKRFQGELEDLAANYGCTIHYYTTDQEQEIIDQVYNKRS